MKLNKTDKIVDGVKVGEHYQAVVITDKWGNIYVYDASIVDWREMTDCDTLSIDEINIPI